MYWVIIESRIIYSTLCGGASSLASCMYGAEVMLARAR